MTEHNIRQIAIVLAFVASLGATLVLILVDPENILIENLKGALLILTPAVIDSTRVTKKIKLDSLRPPPSDDK